MLRMAAALILPLFLASCASSYGGSSGPQPGFGYAANNDSLRYGSTAPKRPPTRHSAADIPPGLSRAPELLDKRNRYHHRPPAPKLVDDELKPSDYQLLRGRQGDVSSGKNRRLAKIDHAPKGTFDRAPKGAFARKSFAGIKLDARKAQRLINAYRKAHNLPPLKLNARLTRAAMMHSKDLARFDRISHHGSDGSDPWDRVQRTGYRAKLAAENVGTGQASLEEVLKGWKESPGHNANLLLKDATHMGIALVYDPNTEYRAFWTLVIGAPMP